MQLVHALVIWEVFARWRNGWRNIASLSTGWQELVTGGIQWNVLGCSVVISRPWWQGLIGLGLKISVTRSQSRSHDLDDKVFSVWVSRPWWQGLGFKTLVTRSSQSGSQDLGDKALVSRPRWPGLLSLGLKTLMTRSSQSGSQDLGDMASIFVVVFVLRFLRRSYNNTGSLPCVW